MKNEISSVSSVGVATGRVTRARAAALKENIGVVRGKGNVVQDQRRPPRPPLSKAPSSVKTLVTEPTGKRKAVLQDVTNVSRRSSSCASADSIRNIKKAKKEDAQGLAVAASVSIETHYSKASPDTDAETTSKNELIPESELVNFSTTIDPRSHALDT